MEIKNVPCSPHFGYMETASQWFSEWTFGSVQTSSETFSSCQRFLIVCHLQPGYQGKKGYQWQYSHNATIRPIKHGSAFYVLTL